MVVGSFRTWRTVTVTSDAIGQRMMGGTADRPPE